MKNTCLLILILLLSACSRPDKYVIGVSQCSDDEWRNKMNSEILRESSLYDEKVQVEIRTVKDDTRKQKEDIAYFIDKKVDLLIVAPNEAAPLTSIVEKAFDAGIPVIVVDRKILSDKYTAFIGADNYEIGKTAGEYVVSFLRGRGKVLELTGLKSSSPASDRHLGFMESIRNAPGIEILASVDAGWLGIEAEQKTDSVLEFYPEVDIVFSQNDRMAMGARKAARRKNREDIRAFIGIDALPGKGLGIDQVLDNNLDATFIYPTGGDKVMQIAMDILQKRPFERETILGTALVDKTNARLMKMQSEHILSQDAKMETLSVKMGESLVRYANQRIVLYGCLLVLGLVVVMSVVLYRLLRSQHRLNRVLSKKNDKITSQKEQLEKQRVQLIQLSKKLEEATLATMDKDFLGKFQKMMDENLSDSGLNVEDFGKSMGMSRVQLYRKIKTLTGFAPNEYFRIARLKQASVLLASSDMSVSEICYEVGFTSPSYFAKCYKEQYGESPAEAVKRRAKSSNMSE